MLPNLILLGAQKSASTFFSNWLQHHPDVYIQSKENKLFEDPEYQSFNPNKLDIQVSEKIYGIRRPDYLAIPEVATRIKKHVPSTKFIIVLRNPVDRAISAYFHYIRYGIIPPRNPGVILDIINGKTNSRYGAYENILEYGLYGKHLERYFNLFGKDRFLVFKQKEILRDPKEELWERLNEFLQIGDYIVERPEIQPQQSIYNLSRLRWLSLRSNFKYYYNQKRTKSYPITNKSWWGRKVDYGVAIVDHKFLKKIFVNKTPIDSLVSNKLKEYYQLDIEKTERLTGLNLGTWKG